jgi:hypothetical protein
MVEITAATDEDAYTIFETMNVSVGAQNPPAMDASKPAT